MIFIECRVKVNGAYYRDVLCCNIILQDIRHIACEFFIFQHRARETTRLLESETPAFISQDLWLSNNGDLNPTDCKIWGLVQQRIYQTKVQNVVDLTQCLTGVWNGLVQGAIDDAIDSGADVSAHVFEY